MSGKILKLHIVSYYGLQDVKLDLGSKYQIMAVFADGSTGKTSLLNFCNAVITGNVEAEAMNWNTGVAKGSSEVEIDGKLYRVEISKTKKSETFKVYHNDGHIGGKEIWRKLTGEAQIDPFALVKEKPEEQLKKLKNWLQIDTSTIDQKKKDKSDTRKLEKKILAQKKSFLEQHPQQAIDLEAKAIRLMEEKPVEVLQEKLKTSITHNNEVVMLQAQLGGINSKIIDFQSEIEGLERRLALTRGHLESFQKSATEVEEKLNKKPAIPLEDIYEEIRLVEAHNLERRDFLEYMDKVRDLKDHEKTVADLTSQIEIYENEREKYIEQSLSVLPGLSIQEPIKNEEGEVVDAREGILYHGRPLASLSTTETMTFGIELKEAMSGKAKNGGIKMIFVDDYESTGSGGQQAIAKLCEEKGWSAILAVMDTDQEDLKITLTNELPRPGKKARAKKLKDGETTKAADEETIIVKQKKTALPKPAEAKP